MLEAIAYPKHGKARPVLFSQEHFQKDLQLIEQTVIPDEVASLLRNWYCVPQARAQIEGHASMLEGEDSALGLPGSPQEEKLILLKVGCSSLLGGCPADQVLQNCTPSLLCAQGVSFGRHLEVLEDLGEIMGKGTYPS